MASSRRRQDAILTDEELLDAIRSANLGNQLNHFGVPEPAIAADYEECIFSCLVSNGLRLTAEGRMVIVILHQPLAPSGMESKMLATKDSL